MKPGALLFAAVLAVGTWVYTGPVTPDDAAHADHKDNGHSAHLYPADGVDEYEMNPRTVQGLTIPLRLLTYDSTWASTLVYAVNTWNSDTTGIRGVTGFNVFVWDNNTTGFVDVKMGAIQECDTQSAHGCVKSWQPETPSGLIFMNSSFISPGYHRQSDLMHELGHVLMNTNEHYPTYNCTSIMGHSSIENAGNAGYCGTGTGVDIVRTVLQHDKDDFGNIYGVKDGPNAAYTQMSGSGTLVHYFEGSYFGGNGKTVHQELYNWIDRDPNGLFGNFVSYQSPGRQVDNSDNGTPHSDSYAEVPGSGQEWCFKRRGRAGALQSSHPNYWGPLSRAYCIARSGAGSGVFVASSRNDYVIFRVWNFSGAAINNVALLYDQSTVQVCSLGSIANNDSQYCFATGLGNSGGFLDLWYNWAEKDSIGYDSKQ